MKKNSVVLTAVLFGLTAGTLAHAQAAAPTKIAVINLSEAMAKTKEGQKAGAELNGKFSPKKAEYDRREAEIQALTDKLNKGRATMSEDAQRTLNNDITSKTTALKRFGEDAQNDMDTDEQKITQEIQTKMGPILQEYAIQNNFAVVLDVGGNQASPVLWFASATNVTDAIVALYDQKYPSAGAGTTAAPAKPAATAPAPAATTPKPPAKK